MACPFFLPASPLTGFSDSYNGECASAEGSPKDASPKDASPIPPDLLRPCCNYGYARKVCAHAATSDSDAFRFFIKSHRDGVIDVAWSSERDHHPVAVGTLPVKAHTAAITPLERQAHTFAAAYLRQIGANN
jgi:hypothetical protein